MIIQHKSPAAQSYYEHKDVWNLVVENEIERKSVKIIFKILGGKNS